MKFGINLKILILSIFLVSIPGLILGIVGYKAAEKAVRHGVSERMQGQAEDWRIIVKSYEQEISAQESRAKESAVDIVTAQAKMAYEMIDAALEAGDGTLSEASKNEIFSRLNRNTVGESGYTWIIDYEGMYVLSKGHQRDGENIWETKDSDGNMVIQDLVGKGREVKGSIIAYHSYPWLNKGETESREKIAAMLHFPEVEWVVGISTYYDDLVDMGYRERAIEHVKDLMAKQVIGRSGYIWVVDSSGEYIVSKNRLRDGEDISQAKDSNGVFFIQEAVKKSKAAGKSGTDIQEYPWLNKGETKSRMKIAGLSYVEEWDWIIGPSAYYDDFSGEGSLGMVKRTLMIVVILALIMGAILSLVFANKISSPLRLMSKTGKKIADGDIEADIPKIKTGDEVEDIAETMTLLIGAIKFLKKDKKR